MTRSERKQIAEETLQIIEQGYYINRNGEKVGLENNDCGSINEVKLYSPEALERLEREEMPHRSRTEADAVDDCAFFLVDVDSLLAAAGNEKVLVMNFANAHHPGGGFLTGASAQEESLCRASTLYASIGSEKAAEMYRYNNEIKSPVDSDYLLISPNVTVFREEDGALLDTPYQVAVATVAAPNRNGRAGNVPLPKLNAVMKNRLRRFLCAASTGQYQTLVLGAWGVRRFWQ